MTIASATAGMLLDLTTTEEPATAEAAGHGPVRLRGNPRGDAPRGADTVRDLPAGPRARPGPSFDAEEHMRRFRSTVATLASLALALPAPLATGAADGPSGDPVAQRCERYSTPDRKSVV